jgi:hypothetical protein
MYNWDRINSGISSNFYKQYTSKWNSILQRKENQIRFVRIKLFIFLVSLHQTNRPKQWVATCFIFQIMEGGTKSYHMFHYIMRRKLLLNFILFLSTWSFLWSAVYFISCAVYFCQHVLSSLN